MWVHESHLDRYLGTEARTKGPSKLPPHIKERKKITIVFFLLEVLFAIMNQCGGQLIVIIRSYPQLVLLD